jgi:hypothetical protein
MPPDGVSARTAANLRLVLYNGRLAVVIVAAVFLILFIPRLRLGPAAAPRRRRDSAKRRCFPTCLGSCSPPADVTHVHEPSLTCAGPDDLGRPSLGKGGGQHLALRLGSRQCGAGWWREFADHRPPLIGWAYRTEHRRAKGDLTPSGWQGRCGVTGGGQAALVRDELRPRPEETEHPKRSPKAPVRAINEQTVTAQQQQ